VGSVGGPGSRPEAGPGCGPGQGRGRVRWGRARHFSTIRESGLSSGPLACREVYTSWCSSRLLKQDPSERELLSPGAGPSRRMGRRPAAVVAVPCDARPSRTRIGRLEERRRLQGGSLRFCRGSSLRFTGLRTRDGGRERTACGCRESRTPPGAAHCRAHTL